MAEIEIPQFFLCPISLQIMKEPVTTITGITYDRESIEKWLKTAKDCACPVTKQPLPRNSEFLTPNHTLLRLIQAWINSNAPNGLDQIILTTKSPPDKSHIEKLVRDLEVPFCFQTALKKLHVLAIESESNRKRMVQAGVANAMVHVINKSFKQGKTMSSLEQVLKILRLLWSPTIMVGENMDFIDSLTWILVHDVKMINEAIPVLKLAIEAKDSTSLTNLSLQFFKKIVFLLRNRAISLSATKSALQILKETCPVGRNRTKIVESGAVRELIELAIEKQEKNLTELIFVLLAHLCSCAEGREQFLQHPGGIAVLSKRTLRVSPTTDDRALLIFCLISKFSASNEVVHEMLRVGAVSKLCMVMQADCASYLKEKARGILRLHSKVWNNSPCIQVYLLTRYQRGID